MSDVQRHRRYDTMSVEVAVDSATVIEIGDLVYLDTDDAKPAADFAWTTNLQTTQAAFHDKFLGVALEASASGATKNIRVATAGDFEFPCNSDTFEIGEYMGPDDNAGVDGLESQQAIIVGNATLAIGQIVKAGASATSMWVRIFSIVGGGPQTIV